jgi:diguanylate cyclase (GGDEF) domain
MDVWLRIDLNLFSIMAMVVLAFSSKSRYERSFLDYRLFMLMLLGTIFELVFDTLMWVFNLKPGETARSLSILVSTLYYVGHPFVPMCFALFAVNRVTGDARKARSLIPIFSTPFILSGMISLSSPWTGWAFSIDGANVYRHGPLFLLFAALTYAYLAIALFYVIRSARTKNVDERVLAGLLAFALIPTAAGIVQMFFYGLVLIWPAMALSLLAVYVNIQQSKLSSDYLTGAGNRRRLDEYLEAKIHDLRDPRYRRSGDKRLAGFLADVDDFKRINDSFGHAVGDAALIEAVQLLRSSLRADDFLARYAGDEFVGVLSVASEDELERILQRVRERFAAEDPRKLGYRLSLSIGAAIFDPELDASAEKFIERLDSLMYVEKQAKGSSR